MFGTMFRFEVRYHLTRPVTYLYVAFFLILSFLFVATDAVGLGGASGQVKLNAPWVIAQVMLVMVAAGQVVLTGLVGTAILRDYQYRTHELLFTTPISRFAYLGGRFAGAFVVMLIVHLGIPIGMMAGSVMPWVDHAKLLPFNFAAYAVPFVILVVPSVFLLSAIFFAVGALSRSLFAIYTQGIFLLVSWSVASQLFRDVANRGFASLWDPFGLQPFSQLTRYWTVAEKNALMVPIAGELLANRLLWSGVAVGLLALTFVLFRFRSAPPTLRRSKADRRASEPTPAIRPVQAAQQFDGRASRLQFLSMTRLSFWTIVRQVPFLAIVTIGMVNLIMSAAFADSLYGERVWPVTYSMLEVIEGGFLLFFIILITIYAGEAVWRERQLQTDQIADALPARSGVYLLGKLGGLVLVEAVLLLFLMATGIVVQTLKGYHNYELGLYLRYLFGTSFPSLIQITALALLVHVLVNQKYVGHVVMILFWIGRIALSQVGLEHQLFAYASQPTFRYSDMNGFGPYVPNLALSAAYWTGVAGLVSVLAYLFWIRGTDTRWTLRRRVAGQRWSSGAVRTAAGGSLVTAVAMGGLIFYNTNVLNHYETSKQRRHQRAEYERTYKKLEKLPVPRLVDADVRADLEPERAAFWVSGTLTYVNRERRPIDSLVVSVNNTVRIDSMVWSRPVTTLVSDSARGTRIYRMGSPLAPGDTIRLRYRARFERHGFGNDGATTDVVANGTFINSEYFPIMGYQSGREIGSDNERRKEKLAPKERMASIDDESARGDIYLGANADWINFRAVVSTAPDQIAIAPGYLVRDTIEAGRRVFEYKMDRPMLAFFSFLSGRYAVKRDAWNGVKLEIYYHAGHEYDLDRMMASMKASLEYFSAHFSPYQFRQVRIIEFPRYAGFAQAFPNTVPYSESIGFILKAGNRPDDLDMPFYVTAHEVGHQWWAHQVIGANMQGSTLFSEGLANYSALTVVERRYGQAGIQKFLANELDRYLAGRATEQKKEMPLMLVENQPYIHYNKGSLALYALRDYIGEAAMDRALSGFLRDKAFQSAPFTTSREFMTYLDAATPDSLKYVLDDLFRTITLWDNKTESATWAKRTDGRYDVAVTIKTLKIRADSLGNQTPVPMHDLIDIGVFGEPEAGNALGVPLYLAKHWIGTGDTTLTLTVSGRPRKAGIDPYNKLIDRSPKDNVMEVSAK